MKILLLILPFYITASFADKYPCEVSEYPLIWEKSITHPASFSSPYIYSDKDDIKIFIPIKTAKDIHINASGYNSPEIKRVDTVIDNQLSAANSSNSNVAIPEWNFDHTKLNNDQIREKVDTIARYQQIIRIALMSNAATVIHKGILLKGSTAAYYEGVYKHAKDDYKYVKIIRIMSSEIEILKSCIASNESPNN